MQFIHYFTIFNIILWFFALGSLSLPSQLYENIYTYHFQPYNSFRIKCNAINDFKKENELVDPEVFLKNVTENLKKKIWLDSYGYPYHECLQKDLKDCHYVGTGGISGNWDMWLLGLSMGLLYIAGILSIIFNFPFIGKILRRLPITSIVSTIAQTVGLLTYEPDLPFFAIFIVAMVTIFWSAFMIRYQTNCQSVIDAQDEWYDDVPAYAVGGTLAMMVIQFVIDGRRKGQLKEKLKNRIQELKKKKQMAQQQKNQEFLSFGSSYPKLNRLVQISTKGEQKLNQNWNPL